MGQNIMKNFIESELGFTVENLTPELCELRTEKEGPYNGFDRSNILVLDFGKKQKGDLIHATLRFKGDVLRFHRTDASCGCTRPTYSYDGTDIIVNVDYDTYKVKENVSVFFTLYDVSGRTIAINLVMNTD